MVGVGAYREKSIRTIPTRVGRTGITYVDATVNADHPHARGKNSTVEEQFGVVHGPSPRAWGERLLGGEAAGACRTIPTRVGRTHSAIRYSPIPTDHPHARGENADPTSGCPLEFGPSPRAWGELLGGGIDGVRTRTIPTRVGRTTPQIGQTGTVTDHPHARGENSCCVRSLLPSPGPSPRAWGEPKMQNPGIAHVRTIPTRVGRTLARVSF